MEKLYFKKELKHLYYAPSKEPVMVKVPPDIITQKTVDTAIDEVRRRKNPIVLGKIRFDPYDEGLSAQIMHIGPYAEEGPTIKRLHDFIHEQGHTFDGLKQKHHEIYLSDPRKAAPDKLKTVIRQTIQ